MREAPAGQPVGGTKWISAHLFLDGNHLAAEGDAVLAQVVAPLIAAYRSGGMLQRYFFIRYREGGPHLRLRMLPERDSCAPLIRTGLLEALRASNPTLTISEGPPARASGGALPSGTVRHLGWIDYEPELERYGGRHAMQLAESVFEASSDAALGLLPQSAAARTSRLGRALIAELTLLHVFAGDRGHAAAMAAAFSSAYRGRLTTADSADRRRQAYAAGFERQSASLSEQVQMAWEGLQQGDSLGDALDAYHAALSILRDELVALAAAGGVERGGVPLRDVRQCLALLVPSFVHMMHNRMGVTVEEEPYLSYLIGRALSTEPTVAA